MALAPFPYGAVTPRATFVLVGSAFIIGALAFFSGPTRRLGGLLIPCSALIVVAVIGAIQLAPTSIGTLRKIAPVSAEVYAGANRILSMFGRRAVQPRISIAPDDTLVTILLALAFAALIAASSLLATTRMRRRVLIGALLASSAIHVLYATATTQASTRVHGTFINPNHFAGYLEIALAFSFAVIWRELLHNRERAAGVRDLADRVEKRIPALIATILLWCVIAAGIALTRSRGGILAALLTTVILIVFVAMHRRRKARFASAAVPAVLVVAAGLLFVAITTGDAPLLRFLGSDPRELGSDQRTELWRAALRAAHQSPLLGTGLGTFREAFRRVQPESIEGLVEQAHDDFLQILVTGGWIGAIVMSLAFASMIVMLVRMWLRQEHREESAFALGGIGALISLVLHGIVEFNMSIPAIPATLAVMVGLAWSAATYSQKPVNLRAADREP